MQDVNSTTRLRVLTGFYFARIALLLIGKFTVSFRVSGGADGSGKSVEA